MFHFDNSYAREMTGAYVFWQGADVPRPGILRLNAPLAGALGLDAAALQSAKAAQWFTGAVTPEGATPLAMAYAGHQFGNFSPQLGDGRALLLGEIIDPGGQRWDIHLKGSGRTPFSRGGDGKAVLGPVLREYLMAEAMQALGVPTTRALAAVTTGEQVLRHGPETGAVLVRVASSHLRVGSFQFFAARGERVLLRQLAEYAIARHDADLLGHPERYLLFFERVCARQARLIAQWMLVGFVHGVMNTDNMSISGETIDYGPCAFMDRYDAATVFSSIDRQGRYAYGNQPLIAQWNLARLAEALLPLIDAGDSDRAVQVASDCLDRFPALYEAAWQEGMRARLGLTEPHAGDAGLCAELPEALAAARVDYTGFLRGLSDVVRDPAHPGAAAWPAAQGASDDRLVAWLARFTARHGASERSRVAEQMDQHNPLYIPRNHLVEEALGAAASGDMAPFDTLCEVLAAPFTERPGLDRYTQPAPESAAPHVTYCGT